MKRLAFLVGTFCLGIVLANAAAAQSSVAVPNFWDPRIRLDKPEAGPPRVVRFLTDDDYPPLHFAGPDGTLTGFSVELARAVCEKLMWTCTVQARRFDTLLDSLAEARGDVLAAAMSVSPQIRTRFAASHLYFRSPARFVTTRGNARADLDGAALRGKRVAVVGSSAHQAFLERLMPFVQRREVPDLNAAVAALRSGDAEYVFGDGVALSLLLAGRSGNELAFSGGPYLESRYFGEGVSFLMRKDDAALVRSIDYALQTLWDDGTYARLYLRFFPVSPF
ncbi:ABC transporter substrate-binding protein [Bosea caraganae]|uniref:ABC transporter substrate-binding protein n=1 Tax=Bosea caraganae TaxID=2763117 RepID=A0A370L0K9_9HYPH|nr:transporter substrate-binding domain-containing protein [Bosea caraganae]RDJ20793.1 ABC transporter substrate-binding protein [Bosea caraganae]RDJ21594.1 ABC transporter substrate-binding protein [Bosea caraganae]